MITQRMATVFGVAAILVMVVLLVLVWFRLVPQAWDLPLFIAAIVLFSVRLIVRTLAARREPPGPPQG